MKTDLNLLKLCKEY